MTNRSSLPLAAVSAVLLLQVAGCGTADDVAEPTSTQDSAYHQESPASACLPERARCELGNDTCCDGTTCEEYTVYDYPRCIKNREPEPTTCLAKGETCVVGTDTCCGGTCIEYTVYDYPRCFTNDQRLPPGACLPKGSACVVGTDTCCGGTCIEYTVYDYPRCFTN